MKIHFDGADQTVTGSQHLLEINGKLLLLDCGIFQGHRDEFYSVNRNFHFDPKSLGAVILSHAHIDHSGNLPNLVKQGFDGPIYTTPASEYLTEIMLADSGHIQEADAIFANKYGLPRGKAPVIPLYIVVQKSFFRAKQNALVAVHFGSKSYQGHEEIR